MATSINVKDAAGSTVSVATLDAIAALVGEVQASPTALTLLDRLKTLHADLIAATPAGSAIIGKVTTDQTTHGTTDLVAADITKVAGSAISQGHGTAAAAIRVELPTDGTGVVGLAAGTAIVGKVGIDQTTPGTTNGVQVLPGASGGCSTYRNIDLGVTGQVVKASAGQLYGGLLKNRASSERVVRLYNKATAPTQADTPVMTVPLDPGQVLPLTLVCGDAFSLGISVRASTGIADADTGAPSTNDVVVYLRYA